ncbi:hypothetical protein HDU79_005913 [Rhizoclosmatium sp. JEL0117]|nr:hypothetical protein HDU79_005913 [Rhizoclosmatium sp. JEL0117]
MRLSLLIVATSLLQSVSAVNQCATLNIADGGFVCAGPGAFTYCSGGVPSTFGAQKCQPGLQCCQASKSCDYASSCSSGTPPKLDGADSGSDGGIIINAGLGNQASTAPIAVQTTAAPIVQTTAAAVVSSNAPVKPSPAPASVLPQTSAGSSGAQSTAAGNNNGGNGGSGGNNGGITTSINYQIPPPIVIPPRPIAPPTPTRTYHSWKHHKHVPRTSTTSKARHTYPMHHVHHYKKPRVTRTYKHHYRTKTTTTVTTKTKKKSVTKTTPKTAPPYPGSNFALDKEGMLIGAIQGEQRAQPFNQIVGPGAGHDPLVPGPYVKDIAKGGNPGYVLPKYNP